MRWMVAALAAACALGALPTVQAQAQAQSQTLRVRFNADIRSTDPGVNRDANTDALVLHIVEGLVALKEDTRIGPLLARCWPARWTCRRMARPTPSPCATASSSTTARP